MQFFEYGKTDGVPLVFQLGTPHTGDSVAELSDLAMQSGIRLISPTRPWYADTMAEPSFESCSDQTIQYLKELGVERAYAMGGSGGGPFALHLATNHSEMFGACYLLASMGAPDVFVDKVASPHTRVLLDLFNASSYDQAIQKLGEWGVAPGLAHGVWADFKVLLGDWSSVEYGADIPVYIHHGESDDNAPLESVQALALQLTKSEIRISPHASHLGLANDKEFTAFRTIFLEIAEHSAAAR